MTLTKDQKTGFGLGLFIFALGILIFLNAPFGGAGVIYDYTETMIPLDSSPVIFGDYTFTYDLENLQIYADGIPINDYEWNNNVKITTQTRGFADVSIRTFKGGDGGVVAASVATPLTPLWTDANKRKVTTVVAGNRVRTGAYVKWDTGMAGNPDISQICTGYIVWRVQNPDGLFFYEESAKIPEIFRHGGKYENIYAPSSFKVVTVGKWRLWAAEGYDCRDTTTTVDFDKIGTMMVTTIFTPTTTLPGGNGDTTPPSISCTVEPKEITDGNVDVDCKITDDSGIKSAWVEVNGRAVGGLPLNTFERVIYNSKFTKAGKNTLTVKARDNNDRRNEKTYTVTKTVTTTTTTTLVGTPTTTTTTLVGTPTTITTTMPQLTPVEICGNGIDDDGDGMVDTDDKDSDCYVEKTDYRKYFESATVAFVLTLIGGAIVIGVIMRGRLGRS